MWSASNTPSIPLEGKEHGTIRIIADFNKNSTGVLYERGGNYEDSEGAAAAGDQGVTIFIDNQHIKARAGELGLNQPNVVLSHSLNTSAYASTALHEIVVTLDMTGTTNTCKLFVDTAQVHAQTASTPGTPSVVSKISSDGIAGVKGIHNYTSSAQTTPAHYYPSGFAGTPPTGTFTGIVHNVKVWTVTSSL